MNDPEIKEISIIRNRQQSSTKDFDPFKKVMFEALPTNTKRRLRRLEKRASDAKSKYIPIESMSAYDVLQVVQPPYNLDALAKLYEKNPAHNAAVTSKAINIVGLGYDIIETPKTMLKIEQLQRKTGGGTNKKLENFLFDIEKERIHLTDTLNDLNGEDEFSEIMVKVWTDVEALGNGYVEVGRTRGGKIGYVGHIPGNTMRVRAQRDGFVQVAGNKYVFFRNYGDEETPDPLELDPQPNEIMHFKKYSPHSSYYGIPDIIAAMSAVAGDHFAKEYNLDYFENKAVPRYAFITKGVRLSEDAEQRLIEYFSNELKGKHHGTLYIPLPSTGGGPNTEIDAKFEAIENRPQDQSFINYIKDARIEVLMAHRVPPPKVGVFDNTNLAVSRDADRTFKEQVCRPEQRRVEKRLNKMFSEFTGSLMIKFKEADIVDADVKSRMHDRYLRTRVVKPNEIRREIGLPSVPEGDDFLEPPSEGVRRQTSEGFKPKTPSARQQTGERNERGQNQDRGERPKE